MSNEITKKSINVKRNFSTFSVHLQIDEAKKKKMSNSITIEVPNDRTSTSIKLSIREAEALVNFLSKNLA
jgi:hypothetical protein